MTTPQPRRLTGDEKVGFVFALLLLFGLVAFCAHNDGGYSQCEKDWNHLLMKPNPAYESKSDWIWKCQTTTPINPNDYR